MKSLDVEAGQVIGVSRTTRLGDILLNGQFISKEQLAEASNIKSLREADLESASLSSPFSLKRSCIPFFPAIRPGRSGTGSVSSGGGSLKSDESIETASRRRLVRKRTGTGVQNLFTKPLAGNL